MILTEEEKLKKIADYDLFDDAFFTVAAEDIAFCEEVLQTILQDKSLKVESVVVQKEEKNLYGRSARLDAKCILGDGTKCNIEVQKKDNVDHIRRVRFNSSLITARDSNSGDDYKDIITLYVVYISKTDVFQRGKTMYHIVNTIRETGEEIDDGLHRIFVNAEIKDDSEVSELMECFTQKDFYNPKFPNISKRFNYLKKDEGGVKMSMSVSEEFFEMGLEEGELKNAVEVYKRCIKRGMSKEEALEISNLTEDKVQDIDD